MKSKSKQQLDLWDLFFALDKIEKHLRWEGSENKKDSELKEEDIDWVKVGYCASKNGYEYCFEGEFWFLPDK